MDSSLFIDGACRISHWGVMRARGADAGKFLQGQLTNDVAGLSPERARLAGFCSAKGRLQASFIVWQAAADEFLLACPTSVLAPTLKRLSMFVLRAQCKLSDASGEVALWGAAGPAAELLVGDAAVWSRSDREGRTLIRLPDGAGIRRCLVAAPMQAEFDPDAAVSLAIDTWRWSISSWSAASTFRRAATPARKSSHAASIAARRSAAPCSSLATHYPRRARMSSRALRRANPWAPSSTQRATPARPAAARSSRFASLPSMPTSCASARSMGRR